MSAVLDAIGTPQDAARAVAAALLTWARLLPVTWLAPFLSVRGAPAMLSIAASLVLTACLLPSALAAAPALPTSLVALAPLLVREVALGAVYGLALSLPLIALSWGGSLADRLRGAGAASEGVPSPLSQLYLWLGVALFVALGGHRVALETLAATFVRAPIGRLEALAGGEALLLSSARLCGDALGSALTLALPVALAVVLAEVAVGFATRTALAVRGAGTLPAGRALLGLAVVLMGLPVLMQRLPAALSTGLRTARDLMIP